jgi:hypothetical protein
MRRLFRNLVAVVVAGCSRAQPPIGGEVPQRPGSGSDSAAAGNVTKSVQASDPTPTGVYPEKAEVERLLSRARELERQHQFEEALALVNQALQADPGSPSATAMRRRLEEIVKRL